MPVGCGCHWSRDRLTRQLRGLEERSKLHSGFPRNLAPPFLIGSIVISLSCCCLPNDDGPAPPPVQKNFLEPPLL